MYHERLKTRTAQVENYHSKLFGINKDNSTIFDEFRPSRNYSINQNHIALGGLESNQSKAFDNHLGMNSMKKCHESRLQYKLKKSEF